MATKKKAELTPGGTKASSAFANMPLSNLALAAQTNGKGTKGLDRVVSGDVTALARHLSETNYNGGSGSGGTGSDNTWRTTAYSAGSPAGVSKSGSPAPEMTGKYLTGPGADIFAENPVAMAADILEAMFPNTNQGLGLLEQLRPYGDAANVLFLAQQGQDAEGGTKEDWLAWLENYWNTLMTPGASLGDPAQLWHNLLNPAQNSPLVSYLAVQDPAQQARNFRGVAAGIAGTMLHPLIADAVMDNLNYRQDAFLGEAARGATDPFYEWIQGVMPYLDRFY